MVSFSDDLKGLIIADDDDIPDESVAIGDLPVVADAVDRPGPPETWPGTSHLNYRTFGWELQCD